MYFMFNSMMTDDARALEECANQGDDWNAAYQHEEYWMLVTSDEECRKYVEYDQGAADYNRRDYWELTQEEKDYLNDIAR